jgi:8-oxo-dGTP pyrophosphatase MutT (NUDIX family)
VELDLADVCAKLMRERGGEMACAREEVEEETRHRVSSMMSGLDFT